MRARPGEIRPTYLGGAQDKTVSSVLRKTVITFLFLSGIGHMTYRSKSLGTSYHLQFESHQNHLYIERYVHSKSALCHSFFTHSTKHLQGTIQVTILTYIYFLRFFLLATLLISRTPMQFLEKREVESKKKRDPCGRREIERVYCPKKKCSKQCYQDRDPTLDRRGW